MHAHRRRFPFLQPASAWQSGALRFERAEPRSQTSEPPGVQRSTPCSSFRSARVCLAFPPLAAHPHLARASDLHALRGMSLQRVCQSITHTVWCNVHLAFRKYQITKRQNINNYVTVLINEGLSLTHVLLVQKPLTWFQTHDCQWRQKLSQQRPLVFMRSRCDFNVTVTHKPLYYVTSISCKYKVDSN